ncbi:MAG: AAA family ATPase, partial [Leadbetterella sp.]|nr:AAA family ATPase [Leadbetterella sp.]
KESSMGNIYGEKGRGKTLFLHSLAHAITSDTEFGPWPVHNNVPCAIIDGELVMEEIFDRIKDITPTFESKHPLMLISNAYRVYQGKKPINLLDSMMQDWLLEKFLKYGIKVAFFDNLSCLAPGIDENAKKDYDPINQFRIKLKHNGIANDLVHHLGKTEKQRGTSGRDDNVDTIMILKKIPGYTPDMGARFNIEFDKARVKNDDLHLIREIEASYVKDPVGENVWAWDTKIIKNEKQYKRNLEFAKIAQFITDGITDQKVIANRLGCVQSTVSKKMSGMVFEGYLIKEGEVYSLTISGEDLREAFPSRSILK